MGQLIDRTGERFGRLVAVSPTQTVLSSGRRMPAWVCRCDCGNETTVLTVNLIKPGHSTSCGCYARDVAGQSNVKHGATRTKDGRQRWPEFSVWNEMKRRCHVETSNRYEYYGARGIKVCDRWRFGEDGKSGFECFIADMGRRPAKGMSIDRINNDGNYEPENCKWSDQSEQRRNSRKPGTVKPLTKSPTCRSGHLLAEVGMYLTKDGRRICKVCHSIRMKRYHNRINLERRV